MISVPGRIPVHIFPLFWFLTFLIGWLNAGTIAGIAVWTLVILVSVLVHEYGHALTALAFGQQAEINLVGTGGLTVRSGPSLKSLQEFLIVLAGPVAGLVLGFLAYEIKLRIDPRFSLLHYILETAVYVNIFWSIVNLFPIMPLDGGQLIRIVLEALFGLKGLKISLLLGIVLAVLLSLLLFFAQSLLGGALFLMLAFESYRTWSGLKNVTPQDMHVHLQEIANEAQTEAEKGEDGEALSKFLFLREQTGKGFLFITATEGAARILAKQGHYKQAYDWLYPLEKQLSPDSVHLLQRLAYRLQEWNSTIRIGNRAYRHEPSPETALLNALAYAIMGEATPAVGWLDCAIRSGLSGIQEIVRYREFDSIRDTEEFRNLLRGLKNLSD